MRTLMIVVTAILVLGGSAQARGSHSGSHHSGSHSHHSSSHRSK